VRPSVHVDVLQAHQPCPGGFCRCQHAGLQRGELLAPPRVRGVQRLVDHGRACSHSGGEAGVGRIAGDDLDVVRDGSETGPVDQPDGLAATAERLEGGETGGTGAEENVAGSHRDRLPLVARAGASGVLRGRRTRTMAKAMSQTLHRT
jgi:hypothetical protein